MAKRSRKDRAKKKRQQPAESPRHESGIQVRALATTVAADAPPAEAPAVAADAHPAEAPADQAGEAGEAGEHRASTRVSVAVDIHLASDSQFFSGLSGDISEGGLFFSTYRPLQIGSAVDLEFSLPGSNEAVHARGEVKWLREHAADVPRGVGIAFEDLSEHDRERIHRFCTMRPPLYYEDVG